MLRVSLSECSFSFHIVHIFQDYCFYYGISLAQLLSSGGSLRVYVQAMFIFHRNMAIVPCNIQSFNIFFFKENLNLNYGPQHCLICHTSSGCSSGITENLMQENTDKSLFIDTLNTLYMPKCFRAFCSRSYSFLYSLQSLLSIIHNQFRQSTIIFAL